MKTEFDPKTHIGKVDGVVWPSVTQLLKEFGVVDYSGVPPERLEFKRRIGTATHKATIYLDNGSLDEALFAQRFPECVGYLEAYRKFRIIENFEPVYKQDRYFSQKWRFHGAPDETGIHIGRVGNELAIVDYKCTWKMYESTGCQLSGYEMLIIECLKLKIKRRFGLLLKETGNYDLIKFTDSQFKMDMQACLVLHWRKREKYKTMNENKLIELYTSN